MKTQTPQRQYRKVHELLRAPVIDLGYEKDRSPGKYNSPTIPIAPQRQRDLSSLLSKLQKEAVKVVRENDRNFYRQTGHQEVSARLSTREDSDQTSSTGHLNITFYLDGHFGKVTPEYTQFENKVKRAFEKFGEKDNQKEYSKNIVIKSYKRYGEPTKTYADLILKGHKDINKNLKKILVYLKK